MYPQAEEWQLDTILSEERNCYLYEKMGYVLSGESQQINDRIGYKFYHMGYYTGNSNIRGEWDEDNYID